MRRAPAGRVAPAPAGRIARLLAAFGLGALAEYVVFDHRHAPRRRHMARERGLAVLRRRSRDAVRRAKYVGGVAQGVAYKAAHAVPGVGGHGAPPDDVTLAQKVESIAFRQARVPKEHVNVNAENGGPPAAGSSATSRSRSSSARLRRSRAYERSTTCSTRRARRPPAPKGTDT